MKTCRMKTCRNTNSLVQCPVSSSQGLIFSLISTEGFIIPVRSLKHLYSPLEAAPWTLDKRCCASCVERSALTTTSALRRRKRMGRINGWIADEAMSPRRSAASAEQHRWAHATRAAFICQMPICPGWPNVELKYVTI
jgi:hypothetical protein